MPDINLFLTSLRCSFDGDEKISLKLKITRFASFRLKTFFSFHKPFIEQSNNDGLSNL